VGRLVGLVEEEASPLRVAEATEPAVPWERGGEVRDGKRG
jgi:hypothetical protein